MRGNSIWTIDFYRSSLLSAWTYWVLCLYFTSVVAQISGYTRITTPTGDTGLAPIGRQPALYTQDFGDCFGQSQLNITRFDAAYYKDNMTIIFHLEGNTKVINESVMLYIGVFAYGESRFELVFDPCDAQIDTLCPLNRSSLIYAEGVIPISQNDVAAIPPIALTIPDFEGQAILRIFGNSTQAEIGCYTALVTNGVTFSHPRIVGPILGLISVLGIATSFATTAYGDDVIEMRTHYAHSMSVMVIVSVFQHIFFTGALPLDWPSVLVAWQSNFAWAGGMIYSQVMQDSIGRISSPRVSNSTGSEKSGFVQSTKVQNDDKIAKSLYPRTIDHGADLPGLVLYPTPFLNESKQQILKVVVPEHRLTKRDEGGQTSRSPWHGSPVRPGLPLPGKFSGFAGTLAEVKIPVTNVFLTGLIWFIILGICVTIPILGFRWYCQIKMTYESHDHDKIKQLTIFRDNYSHYLWRCILRTTFIAFPMLTFLAVFQFTIRSSAGVHAIAAVVLTTLLIGISYAAFLTFQDQVGHRQMMVSQQLLCIKRTVLFRHIPMLRFQLIHSAEDVPTQTCWSISVPTISMAETDVEIKGVHEDENNIASNGWLVSRYRKTRWWFFMVWLLYEFLRSCLYGGGGRYPRQQVFGLLCYECIAFVAFISWMPMESGRLNVLLVYALGASKVLTLALCAAFDPQFGLSRVTTAIIGIVIIVVQGALTIFLLVAVVTGAVSTYLTLTRNRQEFSPRSWKGMRRKYLAHIQNAAKDEHVSRATIGAPEPLKGFIVNAVTRQNKILDEERESSIFESVDNGVRPSFLEASHKQHPNSPSCRALNKGSPTKLGILPFGAQDLGGTRWVTKEAMGESQREDGEGLRWSSSAFNSSDRSTSQRSSLQFGAHAIAPSHQTSVPQDLAAESPILGHLEFDSYTGSTKNGPLRPSPLREATGFGAPSSDQPAGMLK